MRKAIVRYNFLPDDFYQKLKKEVLGIELTGLHGGRSSLDLPEQDIKTPTLKSFNDVYTNNIAFWRGQCLRLGLDIDLNFNASYIEPIDGLIETNEQFFYGRMDLGFGFNGYGEINGGKGNHIDNFNRVISGLLYFSDQKDFEGGEFEFTDKDGNTDQSINIAQNMAIFSVQDKDGWHRVNPLKEIKEYPRIAIYFALSYSQKYWNR